MPVPTGPVQAGVNGENSALHVILDQTSEQPRGAAAGATQAVAVPMGSFQEMLLGHRSGTGSTNTNRVLAAAAQAAGSLIGNAAGTGVTYAAATLTDANQNWAANSQNNKGCWAAGQFNVVLSHTATVLTFKSNWAVTPANGSGYQLWTMAYQNQGGTVTYAAGPPGTITDTAGGWAVNQWRGHWVWVAGEARLIVSNTATVLTLDSGFIIGTPAAGQAFGISEKMFQDWNTIQRGSTSGFDSNTGSTNPDNL